MLTDEDHRRFHLATGTPLAELLAMVATAKNVGTLLPKIMSNSDLVVVSHGTEAPHPLFNFGTQGALDLWEVDWPTFVAMESRASAEEDERAERERLLALVREQGYVDGYTGVRASSTGQRFRVHDALVWNVQNEDGERLGQAAMFRRAEVEFL